MSVFDPSGAPWPYDDPEAGKTGESEPRWRCEEGTCECGEVHEETPKHELAIVVCDRDSRRMPGARVRIHAGGRILNEEGFADGSGRIVARSRVPLDQVLVEWAPAHTPLEPDLPHRRLHYVKIDPEDRPEATRRRLHNLGYGRGFTLEENVHDFQHMYGLARTGRWEDVEGTVIGFHDHHGVTPTDTGSASPAQPLASMPAEGSQMSFAAAQAQSGGPGAPPPPPPPPPGGGPGTPAAGQGTLTAQQMPRVFRFVIEWVNPSSPWLSGTGANGDPVEKIVLKAGGQVIPPLNGSKAGERRYEIPNTLVKPGLVVELDARFAPSFGPYRFAADHRTVTTPFPPAGHDLAHCAFIATQRFELDDSQGLFLPKNAAPLPAEHPLIDHMVLADLRTNTVTSTVKLHTEMVDVTHLFRHFTNGIADYETHYEAQVTAKLLDGKPWDNVRALGYTGRNGPAIWMTYAPNVTIAASETKLPCFLMCRHELYQRAYASQGGKVDWSAWFTQDDGKPFSVVAMWNFWEQYVLDQRGKPSDDIVFRVGNPYGIKAGFGPAIVESGFKVVLICPIPNFGVPLEIGGTDPQRHLNSVLRTLWAGKHLATAAPSAPVAGRIALGAWSEGGVTMRRMFADNRKKKKGDPTRLDLAAIYAFDPNDLNLVFQQILGWIKEDEDAFFGATLGQNTPPNAPAGALLYDELDAWKQSKDSALNKAFERVVVSPTSDERMTFWMNLKKEPNKKPSPHWVTAASGQGGSALLDENAGDIGGRTHDHYRHSYARWGRPFRGSRDTFLLTFLKRTKW